MITEDYVSYNIAKLLKEKGFNWDCKTKKFYPEPDYDQESPNGVYAPTLQMVMKWLREEKDVQIEITIVGIGPWEKPTKWSYGFRCQTKDVIDRRNADFSSYEEAAEAAIKHCLENLI